MARHRGLRWTAAGVLLLLAALLVVASVVARFARGELLDTDRYVATVAPLASDPEVQAAVSARVSDEIIRRLDVPTLVREVAGEVDLPRLGALLAGPIQDAVESFIRKHVDEFVHSERFARLWVEANRIAHQGLDAILTGQEGPVVSTVGTDVVVDLGAVVNAVKQELVASGFSLASRVPDVSVPLTVADVQQLPEIQRYVRLLDLTATWLPLVALLLLALAVWVAPNRRRALAIGCVLVVLLLALVLVANQVVRQTYADNLPDQSRSAALSVYDTVLRYLVTALVSLLVVAALGLVWLWLAGPGRVPVAARRAVNRLLDTGAAKLVGTGRAGGLRRVGGFVSRHRAWFLVGIAVLALLLLLWHPTAGTAIWVTVCAALAVGLVGFMARLRISP